MAAISARRCLAAAEDGLLPNTRTSGSKASRDSRTRAEADGERGGDWLDESDMMVEEQVR